MRRKTTPLLTLLAIASLGMSGCETFTDFGLKNAQWRLYNLKTDGSQLNLLVLRLQDYRENDPAYRYIIHFHGNDRCTGTYYAADTVNHESEGTWSLPRHDVLRINLDVVNGDFDIEKLERHVFHLSTDKNFHGLEGVEPPYFPMDMYIERFY